MKIKELCEAIRADKRQFNRHFTVYHCIKDAAEKIGIKLNCIEDISEAFKIGPWDIENMFRTHFDSPQNVADFAEQL